MNNRRKKISPQFFQKYILCNIEKCFIDSLMSLQIIKNLKVKKKHQYFIYKPVSPDYKSKYQIISLEKRPMACFWCFTVPDFFEITTVSRDA